ncbi:hypothetical protein D3C78_1585980 [compost metagenome]
MHRHHGTTAQYSPNPDVHLYRRGSPNTPMVCQVRNRRFYLAKLRRTYLSIVLRSSQPQAYVDLLDEDDESPPVKTALHKESPQQP